MNPKKQRKILQIIGIITITVLILGLVLPYLALIK